MARRVPRHRPEAFDGGVIMEFLKFLTERDEPSYDDFLDLAKQRVEPRVLQLVLETTRRKANAGGISGHDLAAAQGERARFNTLARACKEPAKYEMSFSQLADYLYFMRFFLDDLCGALPAPFNNFPPGGTLMICLGAVPAKKEVGAERIYKMIETRDRQALKRLTHFFSRLGINCIVDDMLVESDNPAKDNRKGEFDALLNDDRTVGVVVVGSEHANALARPARRWINETRSARDSVVDTDFGISAVRLQQQGVTRKEWRRSKKQDVGVLSVRRKRISKTFLGHAGFEMDFVVAAVAGLGPVGTLAAADALSHIHQVAALFDRQKDRFEAAVVVEDIEKLNDQEMPHWHWGI